MSRVVAIVQARLGSTRLPRKSLMLMSGKPLIHHVMHRAMCIRGVDHVVLAVPHGDGDAFRAVINDPLVIEMTSDVSPDDVLTRYARVASMMDAAVVVRLTGDCPVLNPTVATRVIELYRDLRPDFASNDTRVSGYPDGWDVEVFSLATLLHADYHAQDAHDREHVCPWMQRHSRCAILYADGPQPTAKLSVDTFEDFERVRALLEAQTHSLQN